jgi:hypothetical protein
LQRQFIAVLSILLLFSLSIQSATNIGMVTGNSAFLINGAQVSGSATLFDGSTVKAGVAGSQLKLSDGAVLQLSPNSQVKTFTDRLVMEGGWADFKASSGVIQGRGMSVKPASADSVARVAMMGTNTLQVAATRGLFRVYNAEGVLVANVRAGMALEFSPQGGSSATVATGCLLKKDNKFVLFDETTQMLYELQGSGYDAEWGNRVQMTGTARAAGQPGAGTAQVLVVSQFKQVAAGGCLTAASAANAQLPPAGGAPAAAPQSAGTPKPLPKAGGGLSAGAKVGIAVVVIGGAAGAAVALGSKGSNRS